MQIKLNSNECYEQHRVSLQSQSEWGWCKEPTALYSVKILSKIGPWGSDKTSYPVMALY